MLRQLCLGCLLVLTAGGLLTAQTLPTPADSIPALHGRVQTTEGTPVELANVVLLSAADSTFLQGTCSRADGSFALSPASPGRYLVRGLRDPAPTHRRTGQHHLHTPGGFDGAGRNRHYCPPPAISAETGRHAGDRRAPQPVGTAGDSRRRPGAPARHARFGRRRLHGLRQGDATDLHRQQTTARARGRH